MTRAASPLRGRYLVRDRVAFLALTAFDIGAKLAARAEPAPRHERLRRIVVGVGGHVGDAIIATTALARLRAHFPEAELAVVASSGARAILQDHPAVDRFFQLDHWKVDRSGTPLLRRWRRYIADRAGLIQQLAAADFDAAIDLYPYYPNMSLLFWRAGIPRRVGYQSGGGGPLLTDGLPWETARHHVSVYHDQLLRRLGVPETTPERYVLADVAPASRRRAEALIAQSGVSPPFVILHPGAGSERKAWPTANWIAVAKQLGNAGFGVVVTGAGAGEMKVAGEISRLGGGINLVDCTSIDELRALMQRAAYVVSVDSAAGHLAAADAVPAAVIMSGMAEPEHWRPLSREISVLTEPVPCAPCYRSEGCEHMTCVRGVSPDRVQAMVSRDARGRR